MVVPLTGRADQLEGGADRGRPLAHGPQAQVPWRDGGGVEAAAVVGDLHGDGRAVAG